MYKGISASVYLFNMTCQVADLTCLLVPCARRDWDGQGQGGFERLVGLVHKAAYNHRI